jgi:Plasmid pRiA4b ORF-3-like protein
MSADTIARLRITLVDVKPAVLRRVEVPFNIRLDRLHLTILSRSGLGRRLPRSRKARLGDVLEDVGMKMLKYLYDFGDGSEHTIKVERLIDPEPGVLIRA